jgi:hypothetical protein
MQENIISFGGERLSSHPGGYLTRRKEKEEVLSLSAETGYSFRQVGVALMSSRVPTAPAAVPECWEARELRGRSRKEWRRKERDESLAPS